MKLVSNSSSISYKKLSCLFFGLVKKSNQAIFFLKLNKISNKRKTIICVWCDSNLFQTLFMYDFINKNQIGNCILIPCIDLAIGWFVHVWPYRTSQHHHPHEPMEIERLVPCAKSSSKNNLWFWSITPAHFFQRLGWSLQKFKLLGKWTKFCFRVQCIWN